MGLWTRAVSSTELARLSADLPAPAWNTAIAAAVYDKVRVLACSGSSGATHGLWVCPIDENGAARRTVRLLPYASPWVDPSLHAVSRHRVVVSMMRTLMAEAPAVELPTSPHFTEVAAVLEAGAEVLCRHTRMITLEPAGDWRAGYSPTTRNHLRAAARRVAVRRIPPGQFVFERAVVGQDDAAVAARRTAGSRLARDASVLCLGAVDLDGSCWGQAFVLRSVHSAILLHSWFERSGPRGVPSLLVDEAIALARSTWGVRLFDFEGSVLPGIDLFMMGFGAEAVPYGQIRWRSGADASASFG